MNLSRGETERTGAYTCANASPSHHVGKRSKLRRARPVSCPRLCFDARNGRILPQTPLSFSLGLGLHPASHRRCWLVLAGAGWCWVDTWVDTWVDAGRRLNASGAESTCGTCAAALRCDSSCSCLSALLPALPCVRVPASKGLLWENHGEHTRPPQRGWRAAKRHRVTGRERMGSPCRHFKIQSCFRLGSAFKMAAFPNTSDRGGEDAGRRGGEGWRTMSSSSAASSTPLNWLGLCTRPASRGVRKSMLAAVEAPVSLTVSGCTPSGVLRGVERGLRRQPAKA